MKIRHHKLLIFLVIILFALKSKAQPYVDYVITQRRDTIRCDLTKSITGIDKYKNKSMDREKKIKPDEISEYFDGVFRVLKRSVFIDSAKTPEFATVIEKGKIDLYQTAIISTSSGGASKNITWYVGKGSNYVSDLKTNALFSSTAKKKRRDVLGEMFRDNKEVYNKYIGEDKFTFKQIQSLVHLYNTGMPLAD
jgi:hypothetical protein